MWKFVDDSFRIVINIGIDAVIVYNMIYSLAVFRSGWFPQMTIMNIVGISEVSNQM